MAIEENADVLQRNIAATPNFFTALFRSVFCSLRDKPTAVNI